MRIFLQSLNTFCLNTNIFTTKWNGWRWYWVWQWVARVTFNKQVSFSRQNSIHPSESCCPVRGMQLLANSLHVAPNCLACTVSIIIITSIASNEIVWPAVSNLNHSWEYKVGWCVSTFKMQDHTENRIWFKVNMIVMNSDSDKWI